MLLCVNSEKVSPAAVIARRRTIRFARWFANLAIDSYRSCDMASAITAIVKGKEVKFEVLGSYLLRRDGTTSQLTADDVIGQMLGGRAPPQESQNENMPATSTTTSLSTNVTPTRATVPTPSTPPLALAVPTTDKSMLGRLKEFLCEKNAAEEEPLERPQSTLSLPFLPHLIKQFRSTDSAILLQTLKQFNSLLMVRLERVFFQYRSPSRWSLIKQVMCILNDDASEIYLKMECITTLMLIYSTCNKACFQCAVDNGIIPALIKFVQLSNLRIDLVQAKRRAFLTLTYLCLNSVAFRDAVLEVGITKALTESQIDPRLMPRTIGRLMVMLLLTPLPDSFQFTHVFQFTHEAIPFIIVYGKLLSIPREDIIRMNLITLNLLLRDQHHSLANFSQLLQVRVEHNIPTRLFLFLKSNHPFLSTDAQLDLVLPCLAYFRYGPPALRSVVFTSSMIQRLMSIKNNSDEGRRALGESNLLLLIEALAYMAEQREPCPTAATKAKVGRKRSQKTY